MMRVADFVADFIAKQGVKHVFLISGGMSMYLVDAIARHKNLKYVCNHHEQASVMAAEAYGRQNCNFGVACVTAGPAITNTLTGVVGAWLDSSPCMIITGQTKVAQVRSEGVRQFGVQGFYTLPIFQHVTKYAVMIEDPKSIRYHMEKALHMLFSGRPGPVWIEIPLDIQGAQIDPDALKGYDKPSPEGEDTTTVRKKVAMFLDMLAVSKRPLFILGNGVRLSNSQNKARSVYEALSIPVITSRLAIDLIETDHPLFVGRPGTYGDRPANFAIQNSDLIISLGCRLGVPLIGHNYKEFGKNAKKAVVDIEKAELDKPTIDIDLKINADVGLFLDELLYAIKDKCYPVREDWLTKCAYWKKNFPVVLPEYSSDKDGINSYYFTERLSHHLDKDDTIVLDTGSCFHVVSQAIRIKKGQRFITTGGLSTMGYAQPPAIGVSVAKQHGKTVCITGDGSLQMNIQEFAAVSHYELPICFFVFNNNGYLLIRQTQTAFLEGNLAAEGPDTGVWCPDLKKIAEAYGIAFLRVSKVADLDIAIKKALSYDKGPIICEVMTPPWQAIVPKVASDKRPDGSLVPKPYDDMYPFLDRKVYEKESNYFKSQQ